MKLTSVKNYLHSVLTKYEAGYFVLIDPDRYTESSAAQLAKNAEKYGVDALLIGGSFLTKEIDPIINSIKNSTTLPIILFPGSSMQLSQHADAILFLSLISGRNPNYLIDEQVRSAPLIQHFGLEPIPTGYILIDGGCQTSVSFMSGTRPIPRGKIEIAYAHALAGEYLGMNAIYLEAGSGAKYPVPDEMISEIKKRLQIPIIVGGGIRTPEIAAQKVKAGADFIVTGNIIEDRPSLVRSFVDVVHFFSDQ